MPGLDGLETAELIRARDKSRNIPIIFLTADSTGGRHLSRGYSLGAVDYIVKPIEPDILRSKVAVFVELFKKTQEIKRQAELLHEKNLELENANLARLNMLIDLGRSWPPNMILARAGKLLSAPPDRLSKPGVGGRDTQRRQRQSALFFPLRVMRRRWLPNNGIPRIVTAGIETS